MCVIGVVGDQVDQDVCSGGQYLGQGSEWLRSRVAIRTPSCGLTALGYRPREATVIDQPTSASLQATARPTCPVPPITNACRTIGSPFATAFEGEASRQQQRPAVLPAPNDARYRQSRTAWRAGTTRSAARAPDQRHESALRAAAGPSVDCPRCGLSVVCLAGHHAGLRGQLRVGVRAQRSAARMTVAGSPRW